MVRACPSCLARVSDAAAFCPRCGHALRAASGVAAHPQPLTPPVGARRVLAAADLHLVDESAWGGPRLLGTEGLRLHLFNAGHALRDLRLIVRGHDDAGRIVFAVPREVDALPRGATAALEVPSYEIPAPVCRVSVALEAARPGERDD